MYQASIRKEKRRDGTIWRSFHLAVNMVDLLLFLCHGSFFSSSHTDVYRPIKNCTSNENVLHVSCRFILKLDDYLNSDVQTRSSKLRCLKKSQIIKK